MAERTALVRVANKPYTEGLPSADYLPLSGLSGGRRDWGALSADPGGTPADGDQYYNTVLDMLMTYDNGRSKWLSVESSIIQFGRNGNTAAGSYYQGVGGFPMSASIGYTAYHNGTIVAIGYTRSDTDSATFEVTSGGTGISTLASTAVSGTDVTKNDNFSSGVVLGVRNQTGGNTTTDVQGWIKVRWRA